MFEFQWNALKVGDRVAAHDDVTGGPASEAIVHLVEARPGRVNDVAIRLDAGAGPVRRPRRQAVHLLPFDGRPPCWRCEVAAISARKASAA